MNIPLGNENMTTHNSHVVHNRVFSSLPKEETMPDRVIPEIPISNSKYIRYMESYMANAIWKTVARNPNNKKHK